MKDTATPPPAKRGLWELLCTPWRRGVARRRAVREAKALPGYIPGYGYPLGWSGTDRVATVQCTKEQAQAVVDRLNAASVHLASKGGTHATGDA